MAIIKCPECGRQISDKAGQCLYCGCPADYFRIAAAETTDVDDNSISSSSNMPKKLLKKYFGYDCFKECQEDIIDSVIGGRDVLAVMPTGSGKSLCYQIPSLIFEGVTIVISPLMTFFLPFKPNLLHCTPFSMYN